jgi:hypothetical protein
MSDAPDPLEAELSALRPLEVSPGLRRRVAERLSEAPPASPGRPWRLALAGGLAAACLAAIILRWAGGWRVGTEAVVALPRPAPAAPVEDSGPTLLAYERALARSPEALDALLDKHAAVAPEAKPELVRVCAFVRSDAELHTLLGDD